MGTLEVLDEFHEQEQSIKVKSDGPLEQVAESRV